MMKRIEVAQKILEKRQYWEDEWKIDRSLEGVKLGNFAWKCQRNIFITIIPLFEKYYYVPSTEKLGEYLENKDEQPFTVTPSDESPKSSFLEFTDDGFKTAKAGSVKLTEKTNSTVSRLRLTTSWINRQKLEEDLASRKLNMTWPYIKEKKRDNHIPCIISGIVEVTTPEDQTDAMITSSKRRKVEGSGKSNLPIPTGIDVLDSAVLECKAEYKTIQSTKETIKGSVLFKVIPLEIDPSGRIEPKGDSNGFLAGIVADSSCGLFSSKIPDPTLESCINDIENLLEPIIKNQTVAAAFQSISIEDIHSLCHMFEKVQHSPHDVELSDEMSEECREILLFAKFQQRKPNKLVLKETDQTDKSFSACYYLAAVLADVPAEIRKRIQKSDVNLFPMLQKILLRPSDHLESSDDVALLEDVLGINADTGSYPQQTLANVVWVAMLYGDK